MTLGRPFHRPPTMPLFGLFAYDKKIRLRHYTPGRELSVRYVLQGSVRRITDSLRINAQLVEAANASQLWAERFDGQVAELARVQDQVTQRIASALNVALVDAESRRAQRERPNDPDAVDRTMRGMALINKPAS